MNAYIEIFMYERPLTSKIWFSKKYHDVTLIDGISVPNRFTA